MEWSLTGLPLPIVLRPPSPLTDDELMAFSRKNRPFRIEKNAKGEIEIMTPVGGDGSRWEALAIRELGYWSQENGGETFSSNGGFNLPDGSMLSPDASWVSAKRWKSLTPKQRRSFPPICPDFLIEILSESDSLKVLEAKMEVWMANGAQLAWMVDPYAATITIYRPNSAPEVLQRPGSIEADAPVAGFRLTTSRLWADETE
jgi:Uma2 family endonuclease